MDTLLKERRAFEDGDVLLMIVESAVLIKDKIGHR
jgi:hypothetical protein